MYIKQKRVLLTLLMLTTILILGTACSNDSTYPPESINPEVDVCAVCNMSLVHDEHITQLITKDKTAYKFDDIGCMVQFIEAGEKNGLDLGAVYVKDTDNNQWIEWTNAVHVYHPDIWTPMAYGVISFSNEESARRYMMEYPDAELITTPQLFEHNWFELVK